MKSKRTAVLSKGDWHALGVGRERHLALRAVPHALPFAPTANLPPSRYGKPQRSRARTTSQRSFVGLFRRTFKPFGRCGIGPTVNDLPHLVDHVAFWSRLPPPVLAGITPSWRRFSALFLRLYIRNSVEWSGCRPKRLKTHSASWRPPFQRPTGEHRSGTAPTGFDWKSNLNLQTESGD
jgi:hypothetical protein